MTAEDSPHFLLDYECLLFCVTDLVLIFESATSLASVHMLSESLLYDSELSLDYYGSETKRNI
jgi:hypothetical protein